jgi:hypothetical protein
MRGISQDLRFAGRLLLKSPTLTLAALLCLALGIGANTAIFSVLYSIVLQSLPYAQAERLVVLQQATADGEYYSSFAPAEYLDLREWSRTVDEIAGHRGMNLSLTGVGTPERIQGQSVSPNFFRVLGVEPVLGRFFYPDEEFAATGSRDVVLSYRAWQNRFGADPSVIGRPLSLNGETHIVVGVAPASFKYPESAEMWVRSYRYGVPEPPIDLGEDLSVVRDLGPGCKPRWICSLAGSRTSRATTVSSRCVPCRYMTTWSAMCGPR